MLDWRTRSIRRSGADFRSNGLTGGARSAAAVKPFEWSEAEFNISSDRTDRESGLSYQFCRKSMGSVCFFDNDQNAYAVQNARQLQAMIRQ